MADMMNGEPHRELARVSVPGPPCGGCREYTSIPDKQQNPWVTQNRSPGRTRRRWFKQNRQNHKQNKTTHMKNQTPQTMGPALAKGRVALTGLIELGEPLEIEANDLETFSGVYYHLAGR